MFDSLVVQRDSGIEVRDFDEKLRKRRGGEVELGDRGSRLTASLEDIDISVDEKHLPDDAVPREGDRCADVRDGQRVESNDL